MTTVAEVRVPAAPAPQARRLLEGPVLPALLRMGEPLMTAIGTNVAVGFFVGGAGVVGHLPGGVDWTLLGVGAAASVPGALLGARLTGRLPEVQLKRTIAAILVVAGAASLVQAFV